MNLVQSSQIKGVEDDRTKAERYAALVASRRQCFLCHDVVNPSTCANGSFDKTDHIGAWSDWQGNLNAEVMIIGQEWGGTGNYARQSGRDKDDDPTNKNLVGLMNSIGREVPLPSALQGHHDYGNFFFTNGVLCLRKGAATSTSGEKNDISEKSFANCGHAFLRPQIELIEPRAVFVLGLQAWGGLMTAFGKTYQDIHRENVEIGPVRLNSRTIAIPLYHCGSNSNMNRKLDKQKIDWQNGMLALDAEIGKAINCELIR